MRLVRVGFAFVAMITSAVAASVVASAGSGIAAAAPAACAPLPPPSGGIITLTADCDTTVSLMIPDGVTLNGAGHTITAHDPSGGNFTGPVLTNAGTSMTIQNLTVEGTGFATNCGTGLIGIFFNNAGGALSGVKVENITQHNGCAGTGLAIRANVVAGTPRTVTISNVTASGYQKSALVASGMMTMNVSASTLGPPDRTTPALLPSQNGVQYGGAGPNAGAGGTITGSTIYGSGNPTDQGTAFLLFGAKNVTLSNNTITGAGTDVGVAVSPDNTVTPNVPSTGIVISHNQIGRTSADSPDTFGFGVDVDASMATLTCNTFSGWKTNIVGAVQGPCITTTTLPAGAECQAYSAQLTVLGGTPPFTWSVISGSLPPGLALSKSGVISGTPLIAGTFPFTVRVADATGLTATQAQMMTIHSDCAAAVVPGSVTWTPRPGCGEDISVGQTGQIWVVGCNEVPAGLGIWRWNGAGWAPQTGGAVTIAADQSASGNAWVTNDTNAIWRGNGHAWGQLPGFAENIAVGANGSAWVVGTNEVPAGLGIWRWNGAGWVPQPGGALTIAVDPSGNAWVTNNAGGIWRWNGHAWLHLPGCALDISIGQNGKVWVVGCNRVFGGFGIWRWNGGGWLPQSGGAVTIAVDPSGNHPWVTNVNGDIFSS